MHSETYFKSTLQAEKLGRMGIQSLLLYIITRYAAGGREEISILIVSEVTALGVWPDCEDHLQTTTSTLCFAVSDAKDGTSGSDMAYDDTLEQKREYWSQVRFTSAMVCIIQTTCTSFTVVQTIKGELRKLKFKTANLVCYTAGLQQGVIHSLWRGNSTFISLRNQ